MPASTDITTVLSVDDVLKRIPSAFRPSKTDLVKTVKDLGCYHDLWGKMSFTEDDIDELIAHLRAKPKSPEALSKLGPGRLFTLATTLPKTTDGFMVVIGDQLRGDETVFIGWCPRGAVGDLLLLVQFGNPYMLGVLAWFPATIADVEEHQAALQRFRYRTDDDNWFMRSKKVNAYIEELRTNIYGAKEANEGEDDGTA